MKTKNPKTELPKETKVKMRKNFSSPFKIKNKSFTLVEILVAAGIFSVIIVITSTLFISAIRIQKKSLATQELLDQTSYAMEYMSRALRMAKKDTAGECIPQKTNYNIPYPGDSSIRFLNYENKCQEFFRLSPYGIYQIVERKSTDNTAVRLQSPVTLTSTDLNVVRFSIGPGSGIRGWSQTDTLQPRVTIYLDINGKEETNIKIQTTVSQRDLDVTY